MNEILHSPTGFVSEEMLHLLDAHTAIDPSLYGKYAVKQGLRNENGTGVLVGITRISGVYGYTTEDGKKIPAPGKLLYRGIPLTNLVTNLLREGRLGFEEVSFLLLFGELPTTRQAEDLHQELAALATLPENFKEDVFFKIPGQDLMNKLQRVILTLYSYDPRPDDTSPENALLQSLSILAKMPTLVSYAYRTKLHYFGGQSLIIHNPVPSYSMAENVLHLIRENSAFTPVEAQLLDLCLIVQADHGGGNNSAFTTHVVSSTGTDTYSAIAAAVGSLKGPKHGGANAKVVAMMDDIRSHCDWRDDDSLRSYLRRILAGDAFDGAGLIYGMGHAVYTLSDPRAELMRRQLHALADQGLGERDLPLVPGCGPVASGIAGAAGAGLAGATGAGGPAGATGGAGVGGPAGATGGAGVGGPAGAAPAGDSATAGGSVTGRRHFSLAEELDLIERVERTAQELFRERFGEDKVICSNVDMWTGVVYRMLDIPVELYTPLFALARMAGWCAHRLEQLHDRKIMRPAYVTLGEERTYVPPAER